MVREPANKKDKVGYTNGEKRLEKNAEKGKPDAVFVVYDPPPWELHAPMALRPWKAEPCIKCRACLHLPFYALWRKCGELVDTLPFFRDNPEALYDDGMNVNFTEGKKTSLPLTCGDRVLLGNLASMGGLVLSYIHELSRSDERGGTCTGLAYTSVLLSAHRAMVQILGILANTRLRTCLPKL